MLDDRNFITKQPLMQGFRLAKRTRKAPRIFHIMKRWTTLKTQVFREGQTRPWDYEIRILRKKLCMYVLWEVSATPWVSITNHFTLFIELWNAGRPEHSLILSINWFGRIFSYPDPYRMLTRSLPDLTLGVNWLWLKTWFVIPSLI